MDKVPSNALIQAGLEAMRLAGNPLERIASKGRSMIYRAKDGSSVRVRTSNDPVLIIVAKDSSIESELNIEGTDYILLVVAKEMRKVGPIQVFYLPTAIAADAARVGYSSWLAGNPATKGENRTRTIWLNGDTNDSSRGFAKKWRKFEIETNVSSKDFLDGSPKKEKAISGGSVAKPVRANTKAQDPQLATSEKLGDVIVRCRKEISDAAGVGIECVKISVDMT